MQRFLVALAGALALAAPARAQQLPLTTLRDWIARADAERPANWLTTDDVLAATFGRPVATGTVARLPDDGGAARLTTVGQVPGCLVLGRDARHPLGALPGGLPFAGRPCAMQLGYRLGGPGAATDGAFAQVLLTRTTGGRREIVAAGALQLPATAIYTRATVPLQYNSALLPDSVHIVCSSGALNAPLTAGTTLCVKQVVLGGTALPAGPAPGAGSLGIYPNPSPDGRFFLAGGPAGAAGTRLTVSNRDGRVVLRQPAAAGPAAPAEVDLRDQPTGVYTLELAAGQEVVSRRLLVR